MPDQNERLDAVRVLARISRLIERGTGELSVAHYRVLAAIAAGDERASRVAARLALGKPTISATVESLCRRGLITKDAAIDDQRAVTLALTPAGSAALAEVEANLLDHIDALLAHTADPQRALSALAELGAGLDALIQERHALPGGTR